MEMSEVLCEMYFIFRHLTSFKSLAATFHVYETRSHSLARRIDRM